MVNSFIIPSVEFSTADIPSKAFLRHTKKISLKIADKGLTFIGNTVNWDEIREVYLKFFNSNPYVQLVTVTGSVLSFYFENKFYYRRKHPWFGASEFLTKEFVKVLEEKNLFSLQKLESGVISNENQGAFVHTFWNFFFILFPIILVIISILILLGGLYFGPQTQII